MAEVLLSPGEAIHIGPHWLACGDLMDDTVYGLIRLGGAPDIVYVDPPYTRAWLQRFYAMATVQAPPDPTRFWHRLWTLAGVARHGAFVEMGRAHVLDLDRALQVTQPDWSLCHVWSITYGGRGKNHAALLYAHAHGSTPCYASLPLTGIDDLETPRHILRALPAETTVLDYCLGLGGTLRAAILESRRCLGMELNPDRLRRALRYATAAKLPVHQHGRLLELSA